MLLQSTYLSFTSGNGNHFDTTVRESGVDEGRPETSETAGIAGPDVFLHGTLFPVAKPTEITVWSTTEPDNDTSQEKTENGNQLDRCETEFGLTVDGDGEDVQEEEEDNDNGNPDSLIDLLLCVPEADNDSGSRYFGAEGDGVLVPWERQYYKTQWAEAVLTVVPAGSETESRVNITRGILRNGTREREPGGHLS